MEKDFDIFANDTGVSDEHVEWRSGQRKNGEDGGIDRGIHEGYCHERNTRQKNVRSHKLTTANPSSSCERNTKPSMHRDAGDQISPAWSWGSEPFGE